MLQMKRHTVTEWMKNKTHLWAAWVLQSVKHLTFDFGETEPCVGICADSMETAWDSPSPSLPALPLLMHSPPLFLPLSVSQDK